MIKRTITYIDYFGEERVEDFYFNLTEAEITEMELSMDGGLTAHIQKISAAKSTPELIKLFKTLVLTAYGEKSSDGRRFIKNDELRTAFEQTPAYSILFMELATNDKKAAEFVNGMMPDSLQKAMKEQSAPQNSSKAFGEVAS